MSNLERSLSRIMSASSRFLALTSRSMRSMRSMASWAELARSCMAFDLLRRSRCSERI